MPTIIEQVSFTCNENGSDKEFNFQLVRDDDGTWEVPTQFGRRGSTLQQGSKAYRASEAAARKAFQKEIAVRLSRGYVRSGSGTAPGYTSAPVDDVQTDFRPQLLNAVDEDRLIELLRDEAYIMQVKKDGKRITIRKNAVETIAINRKGKKVSAPKAVIDAINKVPRAMLIDGEMVGEVYYVFDLLSFGDPGNAVEKMGFGMRLASLLRVAAAAGWECAGIHSIDPAHHGATVDPPVIFVPGCQTAEDKRMIFEAGRKAGVEGFVFKKADALYTPSRPSSGGTQLKYKFTQSATCLVSAETTGKRSVRLIMRNGGSIVDVGSVTIPPNHAVPAFSKYVEIRYLYAHPGGGCLYQPVYLGVRDDKDKADEYSTLKFKQGAEEDDES